MTPPFRSHYPENRVRAEKAERGMAMPYDAERVMQLRSRLREARKQKLSAGSRERREKGKR